MHAAEQDILLLLKSGLNLGVIFWQKVWHSVYFPEKILTSAL
jgi:hypothetical protein